VGDAGGVCNGRGANQRGLCVNGSAGQLATPVVWLCVTLSLGAGAAGGYIAARIADRKRSPPVAPVPAVVPSQANPSAPATNGSSQLREPDLHDLDLLMRPCGLPADAPDPELSRCRRARLEKLATSALANPDRDLLHDQLQLWRTEAASFARRLAAVRKDRAIVTRNREAVIAGEVAHRLREGEVLERVSDVTERHLDAALNDLEVREKALAFGIGDRTAVADRLDGLLQPPAANDEMARRILAKLAAEAR
jgi:hypothetical protein